MGARRSRDRPISRKKRFWRTNRPGSGNSLDVMAEYSTEIGSQNGLGTAVDWRTELDRHARWLRTVVISRVGDSHAADDVMQDVAVAALAQQSPLRDAAKAAPWLYRLAVRHALLYRRTMGRRRKLVDRYASRQPADSCIEDDPLDWMLAREMQDNVRRALGELPGKDREILLLKHTENWSYRELAEHLGVSFHAVEYRLLRARRRMRDALLAMHVTESPS